MADQVKFGLSSDNQTVVKHEGVDKETNKHENSDTVLRGCNSLCAE